MKSLFPILALGCLVALGSFAVTGCNSKSATPDKMSTQKMDGDKMGGDKMNGGKMADDKMGEEKMK